MKNEQCHDIEIIIIIITHKCHWQWVAENEWGKGRKVVRWPLKKWIEKWKNISEIPRRRSILLGYSSQLAAEQTVRGGDNKL